MNTNECAALQFLRLGPTGRAGPWPFWLTPSMHLVASVQEASEKDSALPISVAKAARNIHDPRERDLIIPCEGSLTMSREACFYYYCRFCYYYNFQD